jgi:hypothetical protein
MTALPPSPEGTCAKEHARLRPHFGRRAMAVVLEMLRFAALVIAFAGSASAAEAVKGEVKVSTDSGYVRLAFRLDEEVESTIRVSFPIMVVSFKKPVAINVDRLKTAAPGLITAARLDPDGSAIRIALSHAVKVNSIPAAERLFVDILPETWSGVLPGPPPEVIAELARRARDAEHQLRRQRLSDKAKTPSTIRVRVATQPTFVRYVFEMPDTTNVVPERADGKLTLNFDQQIKWDLADARSALPPTLTSIESETDFDSTTVKFVLNGMPKVHTFREDRSIVVDIGREGPKPKPKAEAPDEPDENGARLAAAKPAIEAPQTVPADKEASDPPPMAVPAPMAPPAPKPAAAPAMAKPAESAAPQAVPKMKDAAPMAAAAPAPTIPAAAAAPAESAAKMKHPKPMAAAVPMPAAPATIPTPSTPEMLAPKTKDSAPMTAPAPGPSMHKVPAAPVPKSAAPAPDTMPAPPPKSKPVADRKRIAPDPDAPVTVELQQSNDNLRLEFPFAVPTPVAVFRRADMLWLVIDSAAKIDLAKVSSDANRLIRSAVLERGGDGEAVIRIKLTQPRLASLEADGPSWIVNIGDTATAPTRPLVIARSVADKNQVNIAIPFDRPSKIHRLTDREVGDRLLVVTALGPPRGFLKGQDFVELRALPSIQGIVLQPLADDIAAELAADKITVSRPGGLSLSATSVGQQQLATNFRASTFDTQLWGFDRHATFNARQAELIRTAAMAPKIKRRQARFNLARFYLAREMSAEAKGVLKVALSDDRGNEDVTGSVLKAVANVMLDRPEDVLKELSNPLVGNQLDAPIWRAIAYARQGKWPEAHSAFKNVEASMGALPIELQRMALRAALRSAIEVHDYAGADRIINDLETAGVPAEMKPSISVLVGRLDEGLGRKEDALKNYRTAADSRDRRSAAQGRLREIELRFAIGDTPRKDAISELETLTTTWRGDETEVEGLKLLAHLYTEDRRYRDAFHVMRTAMLAHPNSDLTRKIQDSAAVTFDSLFLDGKGDALPPIEALGLFYDFRELTPIGRRGDEMIRKLADRLVSVDLLDQAAELLQHQVDHRLQGAARAQVATRLAVIYLMNRKPDRALATLRATRTAELSNELRDQRLLLEARALSDNGRQDLALELIANIEGREAIRLRADILWAARRWRASAEQIELLYGNRWREFTPLNENERADILRAAIGYALDDDPLGLARFREKYSAKMAEGPDGRAFDVVSAPIGTNGAEFRDVAKSVAATNTLDAFLREMHRRYPDAAPVSPEGSVDNKTAPPMPERPQTKKSSNAAPGKPTMPAKPAAASSPLPPKAPAGVPLKPDPAPTTGSIPRLPTVHWTGR